MAAIKTLDDVDVSGKRVLVRADLNVPIHEKRVTDATRLERLMVTLNELSNKGARSVVVSHLGRPKGSPDPTLSLFPVARALEAILGRPVAFAADCIGAPADTVVNALASGDIAVLENVRFHRGEEVNDPQFAQALAGLADLYVNDAFSVAHRTHASTVYITRLLPAYAGREMQMDLDALENALEQPEKPLAAIVGGSKVSTKLPVISNLLDKVNVLIIGGGMANTFLSAKGVSIGRSLCEDDLLAIAKSVLVKAHEVGCEIVLPVDVVVASQLRTDIDSEVVGIMSVHEDQMILDVGPRTTALIEEKIIPCATLVWNGPVGAFETKPFDRGTIRVAHSVAKLTEKNGLISVAGGGDTVAALNAAGVSERLSYVSLAGGAFLEWLEGKSLPALVALR